MTVCKETAERMTPLKRLKQIIFGGNDCRIKLKQYLVAITSQILHELPSPGRYFQLFFLHTLFEKITEETNLYSMQVSPKSINTTSNEI